MAKRSIEEVTLSKSELDLSINSQDLQCLCDNAKNCPITDVEWLKDGQPIENLPEIKSQLYIDLDKIMFLGTEELLWGDYECRVGSRRSPTAKVTTGCKSRIFNRLFGFFVPYFIFFIQDKFGKYLQYVTYCSPMDKNFT
jgi:hypothetical protein